MIENFVPGLSDESALKHTLELSKDFITELNIAQLQPPVEVGWLL